MARTTAGGTRPSTGRPAASRARRSVDEMSRRGMPHVLDPPPVAGRFAWLALPLDDHDRWPGRGSRRAAATCPCWRPRRRRARGTARGPGRASDSRVSAVTDAPSRSTSTADASTPSTLGDREPHEREAVARRRDDPAALLPRVARDDEEHAVEASRLRTSAATTMWPTCTGSNVPPNTPSRSGRAPVTGAVYGSSQFPPRHPGETSASSRP